MIILSFRKDAILDIVSSNFDDATIRGYLNLGNDKKGTVFNTFGPNAVKGIRLPSPTLDIKELKHECGENNKVTIKFIDNDNSFLEYLLFHFNIEYLRQKVEELDSKVKTLKTADKLQETLFSTQDIPQGLGKILYLYYDAGNKFNSLGKSFDTGSGPHSLIITNLLVTISGTVVEYTLELFPSLKSFRGGVGSASLKKLAGAFLAGTPEIKGTSNLILLKNNPAYGDNIIQKVLSNDPYNSGRSVSNVYPFDIHLIICDILKEYLRMVTGHSNIIVLLPDLNLYCADTILNFINKTILGTKADSSTLDDFGGSFTAYIESQRFKDTYASKIPARVVQNNAYAEALQRLLGIDIVYDPLPIPERDEQTYNGYGATWYEKTLLPENTDIRLELNSLEKEDQVAEEGYLSVLTQDLFPKIKTISKDLFDIQIYQETNTFFNELWGDSKFDGSYTLPGKPSTTPTLIVGDPILIEKYLYAYRDPTDKSVSILHPVDSKILKDRAYFDEINSKFDYSLNFEPYFSNNPAPANSGKQNIPIKSVTIQQNGAIFSLLETNISQTLQQTETTGKILEQEVLESLVTSSIDEDELERLVSYVYAQYDNYYANLFLESIRASFNNLTIATKDSSFNNEVDQRIEDLKTTLERIQDKIKSNPKSSGTKVNVEPYYGTLAKLVARLDRELKKQAFKITVTTSMAVPQFGSLFMVGKSAIFDYNIGITAKFPKRYRILSYAHSLLEGSWESAFTLQALV